MGALAFYYKAVFGTTFAGPTYFAGILRRFHAFVLHEMRSKPQVFFVLSIFTDGSIHDLEDTKELVVKLSTLPVSIIIVGIGNDDFS